MDGRLLLHRSWLAVRLERYASSLQPDPAAGCRGAVV